MRKLVPVLFLALSCCVPTPTVDTADKVLVSVRDSLKKDCTMPPPVREHPKVLTIQDQEKVDKLVEEVRDLALSCAEHETPVLKDGDGECAQRESCENACPIKWYWCVEHAGACAGGDDRSCCKLAMCGGKHHCHVVCRSNCNCTAVSPVGPSTASG